MSPHLGPDATASAGSKLQSMFGHLTAAHKRAPITPTAQIAPGAPGKATTALPAKLLAGLVVAVVAIVAGAFALTTTASAAVWAPCVTAAENLDCAHIKQPIDRNGVVAGEATVSVVRYGATEGPRLGTLFVLAGGPGQPSFMMLDFMLELFPGANRYDLIALDQRGTGFSEPLNCPRLESGAAFGIDDAKNDLQISQCADALGAARWGYDTAETVADIDAVRADLGLTQISLFGVSYGTKLAMAYANTHPTHVRSLMLDSVLPVVQPGAFDTVSIAAMRKSLDEICQRGRCRGVLGAPQSSLSKLVQRLSIEPAIATLQRSDGRPVQLKIGPDEFYDLLFAADFNLYVYEQLPSTIDAALRGDDAPLVRLMAVLTGDTGNSRLLVHSRKAPAAAMRSAERRRTQHSKRLAAKRRESTVKARAVSEFSNTLYVATGCEDFTAPWPRGTALGSRQSAIDTAASAIPEDSLQPFERDTVKRKSLSTICRGWPESADTPVLPAGPLPDVPVLALNGTLDVRTPVAWAKQALEAAPRAQLVEIPHTGHSTIGTDISGCALSLAKRFLIFSATDGACRRNPLPVPVSVRAVSSTRSLKALRGSCKRLRGNRCRSARQVVTAGYLAMRDAIDQLAVGGMLEGPGLYGGQWELSDEFDEEMLEEEGLEEMPLFVSLESMEQVPGVIVDGRVSVTDFPRVTGDFSILDVNGRSYEVSVSGRLAYDSKSDRIRLGARAGKIRVQLERRGKSSTAARVTATALKTRIAFARAAGTRRAIR